MGRRNCRLAVLALAFALVVMLLPKPRAVAQEEDVGRVAEPTEMAQSVRQAESTQDQTPTSNQASPSDESPSPAHASASPDEDPSRAQPEEEMPEGPRTTAADSAASAAAAPNDAQEAQDSEKTPKDDENASEGELKEETLEAQASPQVAYRTHVQTYGWQDWVRDGAMSGTEGESKRLEGINIKLESVPCDGGIEYRTHVQTYGWQDWVRDGAMSGTEGESKRLEAIQIVLVAKDAQAPSADFMGIQQATSDPFKVNASAPANSYGDPTSRGPSSAGALRVRGSQLVDSEGNPIQLRGISTHGLAWYPGYVNNECFEQLRNGWNANVVRLAMYTEEYGGYCSGGDQSYLRDLVKRGVRLATDNDLYAIVDWHILSDNDPNRHTDEAKAFFADISSTFKDNQNVIYEICNEPNGGTSWDDIKQYANQVIPVIRQNDPDAVIIVATPTWSQEVDKAAASPLTQGNVMYALHFYAATHRDDLRNRMVSAVQGGLPVFVSEFGICDASGNGAIDEDSANSWVTTMNSLGVSWCMWSLCNKAESASAIRSDCQATAGFGTDDLATSGTWLLKALNGSLPEGTDSSKASTGSGNAADSSSAPTSAQVVSFASGSFACKASLTSSWPTGNGKTCYQFDLSLTNKGAACSSWSITVPFNKPITYTNGWNGTYGASGSNLVIRNADYNGSIDKDATLSGIGFQVTADSDLSLKAT